jgi:hypothetical protein
MTAADGYEWATDSAAELTEPPSAIKGVGFQAGNPLSASYLNWLLQQAGRAAAYVEGWTDLGAFIDAAADRQLGILTEDTTSAAVPGTTKASLTFATDIVSVTSDGRRVYTIGRGGGAVSQRLRDLSGTAVTYALAHPTSPTPIRILRAADKLLTLYSQGGTYYVDCHTVADTGSSIAAAWTYTSPSGALNDIAATAEAVFIAREAGYVVPVPLASGTAGTAYDHGAAVRAVAACGGAVYLAGASGTGSATMRRLAYVGGVLGDVTAGGVEGPWDLTGGPVMTAGGRLAVDARSLVAVWTAAESVAASVELRALVTGEVTASRVYSPSTGGFSPSAVPTALALDDEAAFVVFNDSTANVGAVCRFDRPDLSMRWRYLSGAGAGVEVYAVATDGGAVFVGTDTSGSTNPIRRVYRGNRPRSIVRRTPHSQWAPFVYVSPGGAS